jgi:NAD(P)-dependent dehydrogenase (short-subunit alcohol dehydrogenase family)
MGAGSGIGRATALSFAREGASVVVADVSEQGNQEMARLIKRRDKSFAAKRRKHAPEKAHNTLAACVFPHRSTYHESGEQQFEGNLSSTLPSSVRE